MTNVKARIENWYITSERQVRGVVFDCEGYEDGKHDITTSSIVPMLYPDSILQEGDTVHTTNSWYLLGKPLDLTKILVDNKDHIKETMSDVNHDWKAHKLFVLKDAHLDNGQRVHLTHQDIEPRMVANCVCVGLNYFNNL